MEERPKALDLFTGVGGSRVGLVRAGFDVVGIDINPQPDYPGTDFRQADALKVLAGMLIHNPYPDVELISASPPCQFGAAISKGTNKHLRHRYPNLYPQTKALLQELHKRTGIPYFIENPDARPDIVLCGEMFELQVIRHRNLELGGWKAEQPTHVPHRGKVLGMRHGVLVTPENGGYYFSVYGNGGYKGTVPEWQGAMGIDWTDNRKSIAEAIPPAYTEWLGRQFIEQRG